MTSRALAARAGNGHVIVIAVALVAVFLIGFVRQSSRANRLDSELRQSREATPGPIPAT
jgi:hypothetical protein